MKAEENQKACSGLVLGEGTRFRLKRRDSNRAGMRKANMRNCCIQRLSTDICAPLHFPTEKHIFQMCEGRKAEGVPEVGTVIKCFYR